MNVAICDDEKKMQDLMEHKIKNILPKALIYRFSSGDELIESTVKPDILFLDVRMPGINGMDTVREIRKKYDSVVLIFVTATEEYVFQAFDVGAFHYLVKPFSDEKFAEIVYNAAAKVTEVSEKTADTEYIIISTAGNHRKIFLRDIIYAEVYNRKVIIHTMNRDVEYYGKLQDLCSAAGKLFFRTHRSYLVNLNYVEGYDSTHITLSKGEALISKAQYPDFVKTFLEFNGIEKRR